MFLLEKWYGDVVTAQGAGAILYAARLCWGPVRLGYGATLLFTPTDPPREQTSVRHVAMPRLGGDGAAWQNTALHVDARWNRDADPIEQCLVDGTDGAIRWTCHLPRALAHVQIGDASLSGFGYVEQVQLTIPPPLLPFRGGALHWGRYLSSRHALIWIAWTGAEPRRWVWLDGVEQRDLTQLDGDRRLVLHAGRAIRDRPLLGTIGTSLPQLARRVAATLGAAREHKQLSRAELVNGDTTVDEGWAIHEEVRW